MKIVIVGPAYPLRGGIAHHTALLSQELQKHHSVEIITFKRQYPTLLFPGTTQREAEGDLVRVESHELLDSINPLNWVQVGRMIRNRHPDLVIFTYSVPFFGPAYGTVAATVRRGTSTRVLYLCHNVLPHERRPGDVAFTRYAFAFGDYFLVQSEGVRQDLLRLKPDAAVALAPHPVYSMFGKERPRAEARAALGITTPHVLLFFGYIRRYKGLGTLIEAMRLLVRERGRSDILLLVAGEFYEGESEYRKQVSDAGLDNHVRLVAGYMPQDQVATYLSASDAVVLPYLSATQSGIAQVAYNFNRPLIASRIGGLAELVVEEKTGLLVPPGDPPALAAAIERFFSLERPEEVAAHIEEEKKKYTWEYMAETIERLVGWR